MEGNDSAIEMTSPSHELSSSSDGEVRLMKLPKAVLMLDRVYNYYKCVKL